MELLFDFDEHQGLTNIRFSGLDGSKPITSVKEALSLLKIRNLASTFRDALECMMYDNMTDEEYGQMLDTIKFLQELWRYPDEPGEAQKKYEMNVLMLLANAIEALSRLNAQYQIKDIQQS